MERLSAPERTREELRALMNGDLGTAAGRGDLVRLALRLIVEETLEGEVSDALGRERYERGEGEKPGYRNGYRTGKVKTAEGAVEYAAPQVRDTPEPFMNAARAACARSAPVAPPTFPATVSAPPMDPMMACMASAGTGRPVSAAEIRS